jgi:cyclopropane fatty-acyl-phospholipid synthase-like methyltransferase
MIRKLAKYLLEADNEGQKLKKILKGVDKKTKILDVGCGFGEKIRFLNELGFENVIGVEINKEIASSGKNSGLNVVSLDEFDKSFGEQKFDLLFMSHIIEHFQYSELITFLEGYFQKLKKGGQLLIITPLFSEIFYDDFDHVKPYQPNGLGHFFSRKSQQVQRISEFYLDMTDCHFRRMPYRFLYFNRSNMLGGLNIFQVSLNMFTGLLFKLSFSLIGRPTGWLGLYTVHKKEL